MNPALTLVIAFLILAFHIWASRRSPRFWFLGGIVPLVWFGLLAFLWSRGQISLPADWKILVFPTLILLLLWLKGNLAAKKRELEQMKVKDMLLKEAIEDRRAEDARAARAFGASGEMPQEV